MKFKFTNKSKIVVACLSLVIAMVLGSSVANADSIPAPEKIDELVAPYWDIILEASDEFGVAPEFIEATIFSESSGKARVKSGAGAMGLMQIMPKYAKAEMAIYGNDLYDPWTNIMIGTSKLLDLFEKYEDPYLVCMFYNEGEYGTAKSRWENGNYSKYAIKVVTISDMLQEVHYEY